MHPPSGFKTRDITSKHLDVNASESDSNSDTFAGTRGQRIPSGSGFQSEKNVLIAVRRQTKRVSTSIFYTDVSNTSPSLPLVAKGFYPPRANSKWKIRRVWQVRIGQSYSVSQGPPAEGFKGCKGILRGALGWECTRNFFGEVNNISSYLFKTSICFEARVWVW